VQEIAGVPVGRKDRPLAALYVPGERHAWVIELGNASDGEVFATPEAALQAAMPNGQIGVEVEDVSLGLAEALGLDTRDHKPADTIIRQWRDENALPDLGYYVIEGTRLRAANLLASSHATYGVTHLASLARLLPERDPHEDIYEMLDRTLDDFDDAGAAAAHLIRFELAMLAELGFGLDLENCAATGETTELIYVSPKSGGAVSRIAGEPFRDRLLRLPAFLREGEGGANGWSDQDLQDGFRLTGLFLLRHVLEPRGQGHSDARDGFINAVTKNRARLGSTVP
jgi:DNA repair protein RecO (recombination protein O)